MKIHEMPERLRNLSNIIQLCGETSGDIAAYGELSKIYRHRNRSQNPVVINAKRFGAIAVRPNADDAWIASELQHLYQLPEEIARAMVANNGKRGLDILDLGANIGLASIRFHNQLMEYGIDHRIVAVEPDGNNIQMINRNIALASDRQIHDPIVPVQAAIGSDFDHLALRSPHGNSGTCTFQLQPHTTGLSIAQMVEVLPYDHIISTYMNGRIPDVIKCDIEGYEKFLPWGTILPGVSVLYIEKHTETIGTPESFDGVQAALNELGFERIPKYGISKDGREPDDLMYISRDLVERI